MKGDHTHKKTCAGSNRRKKLGTKIGMLLSVMESQPRGGYFLNSIFDPSAIDPRCACNLDPTWTHFPIFMDTDLDCSTKTESF